MGLIAQGSKGGSFLAPAGPHVARCFRIVDIGWFLSDFKRPDGSDKWQHKIRVEWELPEELMEDGRPYAVNFRYTLTLDDRGHLYQHLVSWRNKPFSDEELERFDIKKILDVPCQVQVVHNNGYANVINVMALGKGVVCPPRVNDLFFYSIDDDPDGSIYETLPDWLKERFGKREEPINGGGDYTPPEPQDSDVPF